MAQSAISKSTPFCLNIYGTDGCMTSEDVLKRWGYILTELRKFEIEVLGFSGDRDSRLLKTMRSLM